MQTIFFSMAFLWILPLAMVTRGVLLALGLWLFCALFIYAPLGALTLVVAQRIAAPSDRPLRSWRHYWILVASLLLKGFLLVVGLWAGSPLVSYLAGEGSEIVVYTLGAICYAICALVTTAVFGKCIYETIKPTLVQVVALSVGVAIYEILFAVLCFLAGMHLIATVA